MQVPARKDLRSQPGPQPLVPGRASHASLIGSTMCAFTQQVLAVVRENRTKPCSDQLGAKTLRFTVLDVMINNMHSLNALKHFHNIWQSPGEVMLHKTLRRKANLPSARAGKESDEIASDRGQPRLFSFLPSISLLQSFTHSNRNIAKDLESRCPDRQVGKTYFAVVTIRLFTSVKGTKTTEILLMARSPLAFKYVGVLREENTHASLFSSLTLSHTHSHTQVSGPTRP